MFEAYVEGLFGGPWGLAKENPIGITGVITCVYSGLFGYKVLTALQVEMKGCRDEGLARGS